jgi:hypothetical protein
VVDKKAIPSQTNLKSNQSEIKESNNFEYENNEDNEWNLGNFLISSIAMIFECKTI